MNTGELVNALTHSLFKFLTSGRNKNQISVDCLDCWWLFMSTQNCMMVKSDQKMTTGVIVIFTNNIRTHTLG